MIVPVILSGGSGTRLWPLSTAERPKQFLPLIGDESLFKQTLRRVADRVAYHPPVVVANAAHTDLCLDEMAGEDGAVLILEPCARNTAAAIVMAAEIVKDIYGPDQLILVMPSDHLIDDLDSFHAAVAVGASAAETGRLVTFGVTPTGPETGYGYLESGLRVEEAGGCFDVAKFTEKPDLATAEAMIASGRHYWNGGIFLFRVDQLLAEAEAKAPDIYRCAVQAVSRAERNGPSILPREEELGPCPNLSIDYALMERSERVAMVPLTAGWSDVGSWDAIAELDRDGSDGASVVKLVSENCYVRCEGVKVALLGVEDLVVVASGDQILIMKRGHSQDIRQLAAKAAAA